VLNYRAPEKNRYKYRLEGFEAEWNEVDSTRRFATYTNLDPGEYVFRVIGSNNDGIWNEEDTSVHITVTPPWWETLWFRISMVVVALWLFAGGFRWRVNAIKAKGRELEVQVQRMTQIKRIQAERDRILEVSQDMICIAGTDGYFKYLNPAWEKNLGYTGEELLSKKFLDFVYPDDRDKTLREFESLAAGNQTVDFENRYLHRDGSFRFLSWKATPLPEEERVYAVGRDITERKQAERNLKQYQQRLKALATQLTIAEEKERRAIATDLHDQVGYSLSLANMQLNEILEVDSVVERTLLVKDISNILLKALQDTRSLIFELSSPTMNEIGLAAAISEWLEEQIAKRHDLKIEFIDAIDDNHKKTLDSNVRALLFRNVRELLTNVIKHSRAQNVRVQIISEGSCLKITVEDDGVGFNPDADNTKQKAAEGFGLFSIQERMTDIGGSFDIQSHPGKGCRMTLISPPVVGKK
jgi:PAS domain S-box-containing protein